jgi:hypothetical protein
VSEHYVHVTRSPLVSLIFVLPLLALYEVGIAWLGPETPGAYRTGADGWMRSVLGELGLTDRWIVPLALILGLLVWQSIEPGPWRVRPRWLLGMFLESAGFAVALVAISHMVDLGFQRWEGHSLLETAASSAASGAPASARWATELGFLGAGIYEEAMFRLLLVPLVYGLGRLVHTPETIAGSLAITVSAVAFALAHHAGTPGEPFTWYAFVFRWLAGIAFAAVFVYRGFGIAVGAHAFYDIVVARLA